MKKFLFLMIISGCLLIAGNTYAKGSKKFGLGIIIGEPTGISMKYKLGGITAIDAGIAWSFGNNSGFHIHSDFLWHPFER